MPKYDAYELDQLLLAAGFTDPTARRTAWAVAMRESRGDSDIVNKTNANGSWDYGLFQINSFAHLTNVNWNRIFDAKYQAELVYKWTHAGVDWSTWGLGKEKGWAKSLWLGNRRVWQQIQDDFQDQWKRYPDMVADANPATGVLLKYLGYGVTSGSVKKYQLGLRSYCTKKQVRELAPSGPTGYYGKETVALTRRAFKRLKNKTGVHSWVHQNYMHPSKEFCEAIGLTVID